MRAFQGSWDRRFLSRQEYHLIMGVLWKRLHDSGKNWRHVYKVGVHPSFVGFPSSIYCTCPFCSIFRFLVRPSPIYHNKHSTSLLSLATHRLSLTVAHIQTGKINEVCVYYCIWNDRVCVDTWHCVRWFGYLVCKLAPQWLMVLASR